jgi:hypothetical protein
MGQASFFVSVTLVRETQLQLFLLDPFCLKDKIGCEGTLTG